jgi:hypothetical protein
VAVWASVVDNEDRAEWERDDRRGRQDEQG